MQALFSCFWLKTGAEAAHGILQSCSRILSMPACGARLTGTLYLCCLAERTGHHGGWEVHYAIPLSSRTSSCQELSELQQLFRVSSPLACSLCFNLRASARFPAPSCSVSVVHARDPRVISVCWLAPAGAHCFAQLPAATQLRFSTAIAHPSLPRAAGPTVVSIRTFDNHQVSCMCSDYPLRQKGCSRLVST